MHNLTDLNINMFADFIDNDLRNGDTSLNLTLKDNVVHREMHTNVFSHMVKRFWNELPLNIRETEFSAKGILFKKQVKDYYQKLSDFFSNNNVCAWQSTCRCRNCRYTVTT